MLDRRRQQRSGPHRYVLLGQLSWHCSRGEQQDQLGICYAPFAERSK